MPHRLIAALVIGLLGLAVPAAAQGPAMPPAPSDPPGLSAVPVEGDGMPAETAPLVCHDYDELAHELERRFGETPVSIGVQANGNLLQVFASANSGSWTILSVAPDGVGCVVAAGRHWRGRDLRPDPEA